MPRKNEWEFSSLRWLHQLREEHYQKTKDLPLEAWLQPAKPGKAARACRLLGLKIRVSRTIKRRRPQPAG